MNHAGDENRMAVCSCKTNMKPLETFSTGTLLLTKTQIRRSREHVVSVEHQIGEPAQRNSSSRAFFLARNRQERRCHTPSASADSPGVAVPGLAPKHSHEHSCV